MGLLRDFTDKPIKANPVFVLVLGLCPTLAVSTSVRNACAMAAAATAVLIGSNILISLIRRFIPNQIRICLLYTSPSPRDGLLSRMPSSA